MYKNLFIVRHAKSSWEDFDVITDMDRGLNMRGVYAATSMGGGMKHKFTFDKVFSSCAIRALHTASIFLREMELNQEIIEIDSNLYHASSKAILKTINSVDTSINNLALFAHNPGINDFARAANLKLKNVATSGVLHFKYKGDWENLKFKDLEFIDYDYPKRDD